MSPKGDIQIAKTRFEAFSDGVFAIAITLLVLGFQAPKQSDVGAAYLGSWLLSLWPQYLVYGATFVTIGIMWFNHYALFHNTRYVSYGALVANLLLLMLVAFLPYPTVLLGQFGLVPTILLGEYGLQSSLVCFYSLLMLAISFFYGVLYYVVTLKTGQRGTIMGFVRSRSAWNTIGPIIYLAAALLAFASPVTSMVLVAAIAVFYMSPVAVRAALAASASGTSES